MQTFTELFYQVFSGGASVKKSIKELSQPDRTAFMIWWNLNLRSGFDHWWSAIEAEDQNEIFDELRNEVSTLMP